ncbi:hypothetical protein Scep_026266 [Stephania cephalantha]|uniref:Uncharacterized protein n=1 Tax=Stephania cephalantha TaxID=152367 RepID=A0AAP0HRX0_9MAGN
MAALKFSAIKSVCAGVNLALLQSRLVSSTNRYLPTSFLTDSVNTHLRISPIRCVGINGDHSLRPISGFSPRCVNSIGLSSFRSRAGAGFPVFVSNVNGFRAYSSFFGGKSESPEAPKADVVSESSFDGNPDGSALVDKLKGVWQSVSDAAVYTGQKAKEASDELTPNVQQLFDSQPYLKDVVVPVGGTFIGTVLAWVVMPRVLRKFHKYSTQGPASILSGGEQVPYDKSIWSALEDPVRYLVTFMAFSQLCLIIAPHTIASQYIVQAWRGAVILSLVWFLHRWKTNVFTRALATKGVIGLDRDRLLALDKFSSVGLFVLGLMALAEACGVAVQSILTVGGIGGVATAFAAKDILGNVLEWIVHAILKAFFIGRHHKRSSHGSRHI